MSKTTAPPLGLGLGTRLSAMMFLQYAIWGAWLPLFWPFLTEHRKFSGDEAGYLFGIGACGALLAPFIAGQIADRWFNTEKFLGLSHIAGGLLVWQLARLETFGELAVFGLLYSLLYAPTLPLTNALAFHHLPDRDRDFGKVRVWGTVGWIIVGIGIGQWLLHRHTPAGPDVTEAVRRQAQVAGMADAFRLSAVAGILLGLFSFTLPKTPPQPGRFKFAPAEAFAAVLGSRKLMVLFLVAFPVSCVHQFYFVHTSSLLGHLKADSPFINGIFGVGGGGLMTIGQMAEIFVLALMPFIARSLGRKPLLLIGLAAYVVRFAVFAYVPQQAAVIASLALHGLCFGCFFFVAFMIIDEETSSDVRASAQGLFNLIVVGFGVIVGNVLGGLVAKYATTAGVTDYSRLFGIPMWVALACLGLMAAFYPQPRSRLLPDASGTIWGRTRRARPGRRGCCRPRRSATCGRWPASRPPGSRPG